jgi:release factor glutamine methyltransferase
VAQALSQIRADLRAAGTTSPETDARTLVLETLGLSLTDLLSRAENVVGEEDWDRLCKRAARRIAGEPVHRILGRRAFYGLELALSADTLEPRPDTEILVDALRPLVEATISRTGRCRILDLGTGTGAIALSLLLLYPEAEATGSDIAEGALETALRNAGAAMLSDRFSSVRSDWFEQIGGEFDIIASNPPYIRSKEIESLDEEVRAHDPRRALDGGHDGLDAYRAIAAGTGGHLASKGRVGLEIGYDQREQVTALFAAAGFDLLEVRRDLAGLDRVLVFGK